ncbi:hypothetical protein Tco_0477431 [Tanacetum coccineum]
MQVEVVWQRGGEGGVERRLRWCVGGGLVAVVRMKVMGCGWKMGVVAWRGRWWRSLWWVAGSGGGWSGRRLAGAAAPEPHRKKREERENEMEASDI